MLILAAPGTKEKISLLAREACFDLSDPTEGSGDDSGRHAAADGTERLWGLRAAEGRSAYVGTSRCGRAPLLKVLMSDSCHNNCLYCAFRAGADRRRTAFQPEELASAFIEMYSGGKAGGLFLSSGLAGNPRRTMEEMLTTAEILRYRHRFPGYLHLKILPGATDDYIEAACRLADRVSANLEAPNAERLATLCPEKEFDSDLLAPLQRVERIRRKEFSVPFGSVTQFVVGAAGESDRELLDTTGRLYREVGLARAYFSAFQPLPGTPLEGRGPTPMMRQRRLYQADSLLRQYSFTSQEIPLDEDGNLSLDHDPKLAWAERHPEFFPLEVNVASREQLVRVPGIGPRGASAILQARRKSQLRTSDDLKTLAVSLARSGPFLLVGGRRPARETPVQLSFWS